MSIGVWVLLIALFALLAVILRGRPGRSVTHDGHDVHPAARAGGGGHCCGHAHEERDMEDQEPVSGMRAGADAHHHG